MDLEIRCVLASLVENHGLSWARVASAANDFSPARARLRAERGLVRRPSLQLT